MLCTQAFNMKSGTTVHDIDFKRVWLFTTDDSPNSHKPSLQNFIVQVLRVYPVEYAVKCIELNHYRWQKIVLKQELKFLCGI